MVLLPVIYKCFCNTMQLLEAETKLKCVIHLKDFLFKLDNIFYYNICTYFLESKDIAGDVKPGFVACRIR